MRPTIRQLLVFKTVVEQGSFRKSAKVLHTSQPAISKTVIGLEELIGQSVFHRTTRSVELTAAGKSLFDQIDNIFEQIDNAILNAQNTGSGKSGQIRITYMDFALLGKLPSFLEMFRADYPNVKITLNFMRTLEQIELLQENKSDIGFIFDRSLKLPPNFNKKKLNTEGIMAVVSKEHRLAKFDKIKLIDLENEPIIGGDARWDRYTDLLHSHCIEKGFTLKIQQRAYLRDEMLTMVMGGLGVLIYPECILKATRFGLKAISITDVPKIITTSVIWRKDSPNPILPAFIKQLKKKKKGPPIGERGLYS
ncbi:MAG: LysR family transcriptional regulator [Hyphomicrobiales bacterium]